MEKSISVIGGDLRSLKLIELLEKDGFDVYTYGFELAEELLKKSKVTICENLNTALKKSKVIISPIPLSSDRQNLLTPFNQEKIAISDFLDNIEGKIVIGGNFSEEIRKKLEAKNVEYIDLIKREEFSVLNAISTAEGTIEIMIRETQRTIHGSKILIMGFGRVGKVLADKLAGIGADVYCEARKNEDIAWIKTYGYKPVKLSELNEYLNQFEIIVNTIPFQVLDEKRLELVKQDAVLIDLASNPGGIDRNAAKNKKIKLIWALSLPGKVAPITSAEFIKETLDNVLKELK
ncbi:MAG: dipicolinate synthase subunit DpsA [Clostridia bacterium]|nr:dipicolinate synthase subunit DpsA [Clostridia bacterium]